MKGGGGSQIDPSPQEKLPLKSNILPMLVLAFFEYSRLNQIIFCFRILFSLLRSSEIFGTTKVNSFRKPLFFNASRYGWILFKKTSSFDDKFDNLLLIDSGICLIILGGWLEFTLMYIGLSFGFLYGL